MSNVVNDGKKGMAWTRTRNFLAGYSSGVCLVLAGHPFDTIKVSSMQIIRGVGVEKTSSLPAHETPTYQRTVAFGNAYIQLAAAVCAGWFERRLCFTAHLKALLSLVRGVSVALLHHN